LKYVLKPEIAKKITKTLYFGGSRSFEVIDVDIPIKRFMPSFEENPLTP